MDTASTRKTMTREDLAVLFPGRTVTFREKGVSLSIKVQPLFAYQQLDLLDLFQAIEKETGRQVMERLDRIIAECVDFDIKLLPHDKWATVVGAWVEESFGTVDKIRPYMAPIEKILSMGGKRINLLPRLLNSLSAAATRIETFLSDGPSADSGTSQQSLPEDASTNSSPQLSLTG